MSEEFDYDRSQQQHTHRAAQADAAVASHAVEHSALTALPDISGHAQSLFSSTAFYGRGNGPVRTSMFQNLQQVHGNRAVQRFLNQQRNYAHDLSHATIQRCGPAGCKGSCQEEEQPMTAPAASVQREPNPPATGGTATPAAPAAPAATTTSTTTPAPAPASGYVVSLPDVTLFESLIGNIDLGKGIEKTLPIYDEIFEVPYIGPTKFTLDAKGKLVPTLKATLERGYLHNIKVETAHTASQVMGKATGPDSLGGKAGGAAGGWARDLAGKVLSPNNAETAGGVVGGLAGGLAGGIPGMLAGIKTGAGLGDLPSDPSTRVSGTAQFSTGAKLRGDLTGTGEISGIVNPLLLPMKGKAKGGLEGTLWAELGAPMHSSVTLSYQDGKITTDEIKIELSLQAALGAKLKAFAEARFKLGFGSFGDEKDTPAPAPAAPAGQQGGQPAQGPAKDGATAPGTTKPVCKPAGGAPADNSTFSREKVWRREWPLFEQKWEKVRKWDFGAALSAKMTNGKPESKVVPSNKTNINFEEVVNAIKELGKVIMKATDEPASPAGSTNSQTGDEANCVPASNRPSKGETILVKENAGSVGSKGPARQRWFRAEITDMPEGEASDVTKFVSYNIQRAGQTSPIKTRLGFFLGDFNGDQRRFKPFDAAALKEDLKDLLNHTLVKPGPYAVESLSTNSRATTRPDRERIQPIGEKYGCHHGGKSDGLGGLGKYIPDHQPPSGLVEHQLASGSQVLYPHCEAHSKAQATVVAEIVGIWTGKRFLSED